MNTQVSPNAAATWIQKTLAPVETAANKVNGAMYGTPATPAMGTDAYQSSAVAPAAAKVPLYQFFDDRMRPPHRLDSKIASRLSMIGVNDSADFLKVANTPFKRTMISYLAAGLFLGKQDRQYANYQISAWAGQADLMRTGADLSTARLLQVSGAGDVANLSRYRGGIDKGAFYAAMAANAIQYGYHMPTFNTVSQLIDRSANLQPEIRWN